uniref:Limb development membrane protein 1 n=1 Tax=Hippocampus comes TaxID=109280 RepID=A0A3Q2XY66_HIPCM
RMEADDVTIREQNFHSQVREYIICFLLFAVLYIVSYFIVTRYRRKTGKCVFEILVSGRHLRQVTEVLTFNFDPKKILNVFSPFLSCVVYLR